MRHLGAAALGRRGRLPISLEVHNGRSRAPMRQSHWRSSPIVAPAAAPAHHRADRRTSADAVRRRRLAQHAGGATPRAAGVALPELPREVPGRVVAFRHLLRPRHVDVAAPADAGVAGRSGRGRAGFGAGAANAGGRSGARGGHRRVRRAAPSQEQGRRDGPRMRRSTTTR